MMIEFLKNIALSIELHPYLSEIEGVCRIKNTNENTQIFPDEIHDNVFFLREGVMKSFYIQENGREYTDWLFAKGDIVFSPESLFYGHFPRIGLQSLTSSVVIKIKKTDYFAFRNKYPPFKELTKSLELDLLKRQQEHRENERLLFKTDLYSMFAEKYPYIISRIQAKEIASFFCINANTVSVLKKNYQQNSKSQNRYTN